MPDLDAIKAKWLSLCGYCDAGLPMGCTCTGDDPRNTIAKLVAEVERLGAKLEVVDALKPANDLVRKMRAETDAANAAHIESLQVEAIEQRQRAEQAEAEVERLKANQQPDGGEWDVITGEIDGEGRFWQSSRGIQWRTDTHRRRIWTSPWEPIPPESESKPSDTPPASTTDQTAPQTP